MGKRGRKPKVHYDSDLDNSPVKENFLEMEEELLNSMDHAEIDKYIRPKRRLDYYSDDEEDSFAFWYGYN